MFKLPVSIYRSVILKRLGTTSRRGNARLRRLRTASRCLCRIFGTVMTVQRTLCRQVRVGVVERSLRIGTLVSLFCPSRLLLSIVTGPRLNLGRCPRARMITLLACFVFKTSIGQFY